MSNFSGNVRKNANSFKPQTRAGDGAGVGRVVGGVYAGQDAPVVFEKANQPVLDTDKTPRTDGLGENELGLSGQVDHPDRDGGAQYLAGRIAREYRRLTADGAGIETMSREQRRSLADQLIQGVYDGNGQHPSGEAGSKSQADALQYVRQVAELVVRQRLQRALEPLFYSATYTTISAAPAHLVPRRTTAAARRKRRAEQNATI